MKDRAENAILTYRISMRRLVAIIHNAFEALRKRQFVPLSADRIFSAVVREAGHEYLCVGISTFALSINLNLLHVRILSKANTFVRFAFWRSVHAVDCYDVWFFF